MVKQYDNTHMTPHDHILHLAQRKGLLRARDLAPHHLPRRLLTELLANGRLEKSARGLYRLPDVEPSPHHALALAAARAPSGVICLLSALRFHDATLQNPHEVWLALPPGTRAPAPDYPPLRIAHFSGPSLTEGIERRKIEKTEVPIYSLPKTIADCFKFRHKIGIDVATEALQIAWRSRKLDADELWRFARLCRVANVMRPYLDMLQ